MKKNEELPVQQKVEIVQPGNKETKQDSELKQELKNESEPPQ